LHVFCDASLEQKVYRLVANGNSEKQAIKLAERVDAGRVEYVKGTSTWTGPTGSFSIS
jgi:hypothetical protein